MNSEQLNMIEDNTTWYLGTVSTRMSYKLAKYRDTSSKILTTKTTISKVGLLRFGELMSGKFNIGNNPDDTYWLLTPFNDIDSVRYNFLNGSSNPLSINDSSGIKPSLNLKSNVIITGGDGTKNNPFILSGN